MCNAWTAGYRQNINFSDDYSMLREDYPDIEGWQVSGSKRPMRGSFLGMTMRGRLEYRCRYGYHALLAVKIANIARRRLYSRKVVYVPCKTNVFDKGNSSTKRFMHTLVHDTVEEYPHLGPVVPERIVWGYDGLEQRYFFVRVDCKTTKKLMSRIFGGPQMWMSLEHRNVGWSKYEI